MINGHGSSECITVASCIDSGSEQRYIEQNNTCMSSCDSNMYKTEGATKYCVSSCQQEAENIFEKTTEGSPTQCVASCKLVEDDFSFAVLHPSGRKECIS